MRFTWPWVSRLAYDSVADERNRLRVQNDALLDHIVRVDRVGHRMAEAPRQERPTTDPMPADLYRYFRGFANEQIGNAAMAAACKRNQSGVSWDIIMSEVFGEDDEQGISAAAD